VSLRSRCDRSDCCDTGSAWSPMWLPSRTTMNRTTLSVFRTVCRGS